jgi:hypothetical protein
VRIARARSTLAVTIAPNVDRPVETAGLSTFPSSPRHFALPLDAPLKFAGRCVRPPQNVPLNPSLALADTLPQVGR